jgi:HEAT repeat protein
LKHPDYKVRREAVKQLGQSSNPEAAEFLIRALHDPTVAVKRQAIRGLGKLKDPRGIQALITMLDNPVCTVHRPAYEELIRFGDEAVPALIQALYDERDGIRRLAAYC